MFTLRYLSDYLSEFFQNINIFFTISCCTIHMLKKFVIQKFITQIQIAGLMLKKILRYAVLTVSCLVIIGCGTNERVAGAAIGAGLLAALIGLASTYNHQTIGTYLGNK